MIKYSDEQLAFIDSPYMPGHRRIVKAYSGCGKSTSLIGYCQAGGRSKVPCLYLSFNKSVAEEAKRKFPKEHVVCNTMHSLAYGAVGYKFKERLAGKVSGGDYIHVFDEFSLSTEKKQVMAYMAFNVFEKWCNSALDNLSHECISPDVNLSADFAGISVDAIIKGALNIMDDMVNGESPVSHSLYLKLFQLSQPFLPYNVIMVDEAQDLNPVVTAILDMQPAEIVKVGDPHQAIYAFRDAINALNDESIETHYLTNTYRFGQNLADKASSILMNWKGATKPLIGHGQPVYINDLEMPSMGTPLFINRTKAGILEVLIDRFFSDKESKVYLPGGKGSYGFGELADAYRLFKTGEGRGMTSQFSSWGAYKEYAEITGCANAATTIRLITRYKGAVPACIAQLSERTVGSIKKADFAVTSAHKSKGLEHPYVVLGDDFSDPTNADRPIDEQEINLMYVALTRAENAIHYGANFKKLLTSKKPK
jgi:hypothetical protein